MEHIKAYLLNENAMRKRSSSDDIPAQKTSRNLQNIYSEERDPDVGEYTLTSNEKRDVKLKIFNFFMIKRQRSNSTSPPKQ